MKRWDETNYVCRDKFTCCSRAFDNHLCHRRGLEGGTKGSAVVGGLAARPYHWFGLEGGKGRAGHTVEVQVLQCRVSFETHCQGFGPRRSNLIPWKTKPPEHYKKRRRPPMTFKEMALLTSICVALKETTHFFAEVVGMAMLHIS